MLKIWLFVAHNSDGKDSDDDDDDDDCLAECTELVLGCVESYCFFVALLKYHWMSGWWMKFVSVGELCIVTNVVVLSYVI